MLSVFCKSCHESFTMRACHFAPFLLSSRLRVPTTLPLFSCTRSRVHSVMGKTCEVLWSAPRVHRNEKIIQCGMERRKCRRRYVVVEHD